MAQQRTTTPIVTAEEMNGKIVHITFIDGKKYKLQHPGNRTKLAWEKETMNVATGMDREKYLDYAFEHCVIPEDHDSKPTIDNLHPKELEVWEKLLRRFLDGDIQYALAESDEAGTKRGRTVQGNKE